jgi:hypothetical protein
MLQLITMVEKIQSNIQVAGLVVSLGEGSRELGSPLFASFKCSPIVKNFKKILLRNTS